MKGGGMAIIGGSCPKKGGFKTSAHHDIEELKVETLGALNYWGDLNLRRGPDLKGGISHPSSYHEFNLASYNLIVFFNLADV